MHDTGEHGQTAILKEVCTEYKHGTQLQASRQMDHQGFHLTIKSRSSCLWISESRTFRKTKNGLVEKDSSSNIQRCMCVNLDEKINHSAMSCNGL